MKLKTIILACSVFGLANTSFAASEFDQYLQQQKILDSKFKITNKAALNELLTLLSAEDSKTLPLQIDQNTIIEQLELTASATKLTGAIITPDFAQFEEQLGEKEVTKVIRENLLNNCEIFFEHEYQRRNPYRIDLNLNSTTTSYQLRINQKDCKF